MEVLLSDPLVTKEPIDFYGLGRPGSSRFFRYTLNIEPVSAPRQSSSDRYRVRDAVLKYRRFRDELRLGWRAVGESFPDFGARLYFYIAMPKSWPKKKQAEMMWFPHQVKKRKDVDNLVKAVFDTLRPDDDGCIWGVHAEKFWAPEEGGFIQIEIPTERGADVRRIPLNFDSFRCRDMYGKTLG